MHIFGHLRGEISRPLRLPLNLITHDSHQLTRTLSSWDTLSFWRERLRDCLGSASPSVPPSWYGQIPESLHLNKITADHPSIFGGKSWKAITNYVGNRPKWRQPQTTTSGGLPSLTVISANLWGQWTIRYKYYSFNNLISMLLIYMLHKTHLTESTFQVSSNDNLKHQLRLEMQSK